MAMLVSVADENPLPVEDASENVSLGMIRSFPNDVERADDEEEPFPVVETETVDVESSKSRRDGVDGTEPDESEKDL